MKPLQDLEYAELLGSDIEVDDAGATDLQGWFVDIFHAVTRMFDEAEECR